MTWRDRAACLDEDPELFFPIGNTDPAFRQIERAKVVCGRCEVVETCLNWAIESRQDAGVWGGLSADQRRALKRRTARARRAGLAALPSSADQQPQSVSDQQPQSVSDQQPQSVSDQQPQSVSDQ